jgi:hypothetical protein
MANGASFTDGSKAGRSLDYFDNNEPVPVWGRAPGG